MSKHLFDRKWITETSLEVIDLYAKGDLTIRGLHYKLVSRGMINDMKHYRKVVNAMIAARWEGLVVMDAFSDYERETVGWARWELTDIDDAIQDAKEAVQDWITQYNKNRWERQPNYIEVWIEKKALIGTFKRVCNLQGVLLVPCKGYPSLTFLNEAAVRFSEVAATGKDVVILYFGDHDPSGDDIPRSIKDNLLKMGERVTVKRLALSKEQVIEWDLPPAPIKIGDSRSKNWDGVGQVELDAVEPKVLQEMCKDTLFDLFDFGIYDRVKEDEKTEQIKYKSELEVFIKGLFNG